MISNTSILGLSGVLVLTAAAAHMAPAWTAKLTPVGGSSVSGSATVNAVGTDSATASINIMGAKSGQYPWHVHSGKCGGEGAPVGNASAYPALSVQSGGQASAQATVAFKADPSASYSVNVHKSMTDKKVIACGNLTTGSTGMMTSDPLVPAVKDTSMHMSPADTSMKPARDTTVKP
ncbi:MAG: hypothetical protein ABJC74_09030 [Gemmatimonadota bacterium]